MDSLRHIIAANTLRAASGSDSGIDSNAASCSLPSNAMSSQQHNGGGGGGSTSGCGNTTSHSEATSAAIHDLSGDVNELPDDMSQLTDDGTVSDDDGTDAPMVGDECDRHDADDDNVQSNDHSTAAAAECIDDLHALNIRVAHTNDAENGHQHDDTDDDGGGGGGGVIDNNRQFQQQQLQRIQHRDRCRMASKEEKQRQNEEIVIMESSSVSSETGSWESVFPQRTPTAAAPIDDANITPTTVTPAIGDISRASEAFEAHPLATHTHNDLPASCPQQPPPPPPLSAVARRLPDFAFASIMSTSASGSSGCFIDASSLMDESELYASNSQLGPRLPEVGCRGPEPSNRSPMPIAGDDDDADDSTSECGGAEPNVDLHSPNMSDEQKLLHRIVPDAPSDADNTAAPVDVGPVDYDIQDQFASGPSSLVGSLVDSAMAVSSTPRSAPTGDDPDARHRQDLERKQGHFLFRNSIQHFSGSVPVPAVRTLHPAADRSGGGDDAHSDMSLPSVHSTGSGEMGYGSGGGAPASFDTSTSAAAAASSATNIGHYACYSEPESGFYPDTPHNSIVHVDIPLVPAAIRAAPQPLVNNPVQSVVRPSKDRMKPGQVEQPAATVFYSASPFNSPSVRRKTETCPILSGGLQTEDLLDDETDARRLANSASSFRDQRQQSLSSSFNSWVVDMSDCRSPKAERRRTDSVSSTSTNGMFSHSLDAPSATGRSRGTGFFVNLDDCPMSLPPNLSSLGNANATGTASGATVADDASEKKNLFSMFIDFGDKKPIAPRREALSYATRPSFSAQLRQRSASIAAAASSDTESDCGSGTAKQPPAVLRRTPNATRRLDPRNRHSWTERPPANKPAHPSSSSSAHHRVEYSTSLSMPNDGGGASGGPSSGDIMSILDKISIISKTSSMSIDSPQSPLDDLTSTISCSKSMSVYSNNSGKSIVTTASEAAAAAAVDDDDVDEHGAAVPKAHATPVVRRRRQDVDINETFDKSSRSSIVEEQLSTDTSPITDTDDVTFQNDLDVDPLLDTILDQDASVASGVGGGSGETIESASHTMESLQMIMERQQKLLLETVAEEPTNATAAVAIAEASFVKLSDMDKPTPKFELHSLDGSGGGLSKSVGAGASRIERLFGDSGGRRSVRSPAHPMSRSTGNNNSNNNSNNLTSLASTSETMRSLSRLFPHLSSELSNSMPGDVLVQEDGALTITTHHRSPVSQTAEYQQPDANDVSCVSSVTSSFSRSAIDSADDSSLSYRQPRRLGEDLLKMFLQEIATDVTLEVAGRRMRAHKCILRSRCQYFAAILAGTWVQAAGNVITLPGYSYGAVHFALCHIYSGAAHPPEGISLIELAALADLLGLEGLKEVTAYALRTHYCHNFHKPCSGCIDGILQVFPVTLNHGLDELYRKCLRWTCRHYVKVWPTRAFAQLPPDIVARCAQHLVAHMNSETVLDTILDCDHLLTLVASCRWAIGIENTLRDIIDTAHAYLADHFASLLASDAFLSLGQTQSWNIGRLEHLLLRTATSLSPEQACRSYQRVTRLNAVLHARALKTPAQTPSDGIGGLMLLATSVDGTEVQSTTERSCDEIEWNVEFLRLVDDVLNAVQHCLTNQCGRAMRTNQWQRMDLDLRRKVQKLACLTEPMADRRGQQLAKPTVYHSLSSGSVPTNNRTQDLQAIKLAIQAQTKRAQDSLRVRDQREVRVAAPERPTTLQLRGTSAHEQRSSHDRHHGWQPALHQHHQHESRPIDRHRQNGNTKPSAGPVPDLIPKTTNATTIVGHRRTQSENINNMRPFRHSQSVDAAPAANAAALAKSVHAAQHKPASILGSRLAEIRPRSSTTEPMATAAAAAAQNPHVSSSDSSTHNSKMAMNRRLVAANNSGPTLAGKKSSNLLTAATTTASEVDLSVDSLGGSMHSSIRSNKSSVSQESLNVFNATVRAINAAKTAKVLAAAAKNQAAAAPAIDAKSTAVGNRPVSRLRKPTPIVSNIAGNRPLLRLNNNTHGNVPGVASATTSAFTSAKSSRLPSVNSATSSPRDPLPGGGGGGGGVANVRTQSAGSGLIAGTPVRKSFLSARSKEILASKQKSTSASDAAVTLRDNSAGKTGSTIGAVGVKRPVSFPTTLHLRRTAKIEPPSTAAGGNHVTASSPRTPNVLSKKTGTLNNTNTAPSKFSRSDPKRDSTTTRSSLHAQKASQRVVVGRGVVTTSAKTSALAADSKTHAENDVRYYGNDNVEENDDEPFVQPRARVESKLERSSTFCKESSTLDVSELQIIE